MLILQKRILYDPGNTWEYYTDLSDIESLKRIVEKLRQRVPLPTLEGGRWRIVEISTQVTTTRKNDVKITVTTETERVLWRDRKSSH